MHEAARRNSALVLLDVAGRQYGLPVPVVQDVLNVRRTGRSGWQLCRASSTRCCARGLIDVGERAVPIVDVRARLGLPATPTRRTATLVVVQTGEHWLGLLVDAVPEIVEVPRSSVEACHPDATHQRAVHQQVRLADRTFGLLDVERLLPPALAMPDAS